MAEQNGQIGGRKNKSARGGRGAARQPHPKQQRSLSRQNSQAAGGSGAAGAAGVGSRAARASRGSQASRARGVADDPLAEGILKAIRRILRKTAEHSRQLSRDAGLTAPQLLCLRLVSQAEPSDAMTAVQLTDVLQLSAATVSRILERLEAQGLIERRRCSSDRRKVLLQITRAGRARVRSLPIPLQEHFLAQLAAKPERVQKQLLASLQTLVAMMGAENLDVSPVLAPGVEVKSTPDA